MIKVAITDDHPLIINGIKELLERLVDVQLTGSFNNIRETNEGLMNELPDVLLLDINLPDGDGIAFCKELKKKYPSVQVLALTTYHQNVMVKNMMRNGASGFLLKNTSLEELHEAIETVHRGENYLQKEIKDALLRESIGATSTHNVFDLKLTRREKEILQLIIEEHTTQEIAEKLFISVKTVESHRTHLMDKLGVRNIAGLVRMTIEKGLL